MESKRNILKLSGGILTLLVIVVLIAGTAFAQDGNDDDPAVDHSGFPSLQGAFADATEVTAACLECHVDASQEIMGTTHWTWEYTDESGEELGKANVINNYCVAIDTNYPRCTSCHVGYGWKTAEFDFSQETAVDCLVCHDSTGSYKKFPVGAGHPVYEETEFSGKTWSPPDLTAIALSVAPPTRDNCGSCHFNGGGAPGVKHGDLDPAMYNPSLSLDVHMSPEGEDFTCQTCHTGGHDIQGSHYEYDLDGETGLQTCTSCHGDAPHDEEAIDDHTDRVACQTCHIPEFAREFPTKTFWSWEDAGDKERGVEKVEVNGVEVETYNFKKGTFEWEANVVPNYMWFNGQTDWVTGGEVVDASGIVELNTMLGSMDDADARIFPFKEMIGVQPFDAGNSVVVVPHLFPAGPDDDTAYWKVWDWEKASETGLAAVGVEFSGELEMVDTVMYWPITHQVGPAEDALACEACHAADGRLDFAALGYSEDKAELLSKFPPVDVQEPVEEPAAEEAAAEEPAEEPEAEAPAAAADTNTTIWVIVGAAVVIVVGGYVLTQRKK